MKQNLLPILLIGFVFGMFGDTKAQFPIKLPKINTEKPKADQQSPATASGATKSGGKIEPLSPARPDGTPRFLRDTIEIKIQSDSHYWKVPKQDYYTSWVPIVSFDVFFDNSVRMRYTAEWSNPDGTPWFTEPLDVGTSGAAGTVRITKLFSEQIKTNAVVTTGSYGLKIVNTKNNELGAMDDGAEVLVGGMIGSIKKAVTKKPSRNNHTRYANFDLEDASGIVRCIIWPEDYARESEKIEAENIVIIRGKIDRRSREPNLIVNQLMTLDDAEKQFTKHLTIKFTRGLHSDNDVLRTREVLGRFPGKTPVFVLVDSIDKENPDARLRYSLMPPQELRIVPSNELQEALAAVIGRENFLFVAETPKRPTGKPQSVGR